MQKPNRTPLRMSGNFIMISKNAKRDYVAVTYNEKDKPFTQYPDQLTRYLFSRYDLKKGNKILDVGCGRGEFLKGFIDCGLDGYGLDQSIVSKSVCPDTEVLQVDLANEPFPYEDDFFDIVFSKSVLEHFYYPEKIVHEMYRILKPGGIVITMVPDWESIYKMFYDDYTHRTPFTIISLKEIFYIHNFGNIKVEKFRQLPFLWSLPFLNSLCSLIALISPRSLKPYSKLIKFSKEIMLLSTAVKINNVEESLN
ncbi:conserved hypothetical protein [Candidatus Desulfarcum epimagneticum]|uniref:Methyltransferase type 11 domain-containing protein n=1 Tax=uncultured Desulfobacteraceae bacterium TaxID=218296 RepID=A0A484HMI1_9BACT|nr:conserved hypothetical protein [uncultured Desulfobacteraceae bacterium]